MDGETILTHFACMATDLCLLGLFYKLYKNKSACLKSLQEANHLEINNELPNAVQSAGGVIPYAVVTGRVKALATPIKSQHISYLRGVIYEKITKEQKLKWSPFFNIWDSSESAIQRNEICIPFGLYGGSFFKKQIVEVVDPMLAQELVLSEVYDDFKSYKESISDMLIGFFQGEHKIGTHEVENMLLEDTSLTAVGKLLVENDKLKIMPPGNGLVYFLTPSSLESLIERIKATASFYKGLTIICASIAIVLFAYYSKKGYLELKRRIDHANQLKRCQKERLLRRKEDATRNVLLGDNSPKCVVCLENPVEILILECGHICLCLNCSEQFNNLCPICRAKIQRLVPAFFALMYKVLELNI